MEFSFSIMRERQHPPNFLLTTLQFFSGHPVQLLMKTQ